MPNGWKNNNNKIEEVPFVKRLMNNHTYANVSCWLTKRPGMHPHFCVTWLQDDGLPKLMMMVKPP
jgi:hypothetical protein